MAIAVIVLYTALAAAAGWLWRKKGLGFAAGTLWSILLTPAVGVVLGLFRKPRGAHARSHAWVAPAALLFLLALIVDPSHLWWHWAHRHARVDRARSDVRRIANDGIEQFRHLRGRYPTQDEGLRLLVEEKFLKPNAPDGTVQDPWGRAYLYARPGRINQETFDVCTYGADGKPGGDGESADICNE